MKKNKIVIAMEVIAGLWIVYFVYTFIMHILYPIQYLDTSAPWYYEPMFYGFIALSVIIVLFIVMLIRKKIDANG